MTAKRTTYRVITGYGDRLFAPREFPSRSKALAYFHMQAALSVKDRECLLVLGIATGENSVSVLASKSRGAVHVELAQHFYAN